MRTMLQVAAVLLLAVNKPLVLASDQQLRLRRTSPEINRAEQLVERFRYVTSVQAVVCYQQTKSKENLTT